MLFEEVYELLVHRNRVSQAMAEEEARVILQRLHELLDDAAEVNALENKLSQDAHTERCYSTPSIIQQTGRRKNPTGER